MKPLNEDEAETMIEEHLRERGWIITDFTVTRKRWREHLDGEEADRVFLKDGHVVAIFEAKKPGKDLWAALEQAKGYARAYKRNTGHDVPLLFASDGEIFLRQNIRANTLPEGSQRVEITLANLEKAGKALADLPEDLKEEASAILETYGGLDHNELLRTVYEKYPAYARKSRICRLHDGRQKKRGIA